VVMGKLVASEVIPRFERVVFDTVPSWMIRALRRFGVVLARGKAVSN
jgi:hypothetical protein